MRSRVILWALACAALSSGCSTAHIVMPRRSVPAGVEERAESIRAAAWRALEIGDTAALGRILGDGVVVLPSGDTLRDPRSIGTALPALANATQLEPTFFREGVHRCTDAFVEYGAIALYPVNGGRRPVLAGYVAMTWDVRDPTNVALRSAAFHASDDGGAHRERPCATPMDSVFAAHRVTVTAHSVASVGSSWEDGVRGELDAIGWGIPDPRNYRPHASEIMPAGAVRVRVAGPLIVGAFGSGIEGLHQAEHPDLTIAGLQYDGILGGALLGVQWGFVSASAGPTYLRLDGAWRTMGGPPDGPPPSFTVAHSWRAWSLGATGEVGAMLPLSTRFALDGRYQYRYFPAAGIPGYRASPGMDIEFTHSVFLLGIGASF